MIMYIKSSVQQFWIDVWERIFRKQIKGSYIYRLIGFIQMTNFDKNFNAGLYQASKQFILLPRFLRMIYFLWVY